MPQAIFAQLSAALGCNAQGTADTKTQLACLRKMDPAVFYPFNGQAPNTPWLPVTDGDLVPSHPALMTSPAHLASVGAASLDVLLGVTNNEAGGNARLVLEQAMAAAGRKRSDPMDAAVAVVTEGLKVSLMQQYPALFA